MSRGHQKLLVWCGCLKNKGVFWAPVPASTRKSNTMASYTERKAQLTAEIAKLNNKARELVEMREALLVEEARRSTEASMPSAATQIAQALITVHTEHGVKLDSLFGVQSPEVNTAGLLHMAEWRDASDIELFLKYGADVDAKDKEGFSVLEMVIQGHDGYWRGESNHWNEAVFDVLAEYHVDRQEVKGWIIEQCCDGAPKYVRDFLGV